MASLIKKKFKNVKRGVDIVKNTKKHFDNAKDVVNVAGKAALGSLDGMAKSLNNNRKCDEDIETIEQKSIRISKELIMGLFVFVSEEMLTLSRQNPFKSYVSEEYDMFLGETMEKEIERTVESRQQRKDERQDQNGEEEEEEEESVEDMGGSKNSLEKRVPPPFKNKKSHPPSPRQERNPFQKANRGCGNSIWDIKTFCECLENDISKLSQTPRLPQRTHNLFFLHYYISSNICFYVNDRRVVQTTDSIPYHKAHCLCERIMKRKIHERLSKCEEFRHPRNDEYLSITTPIEFKERVRTTLGVFSDLVPLGDELDNKEVEEETEGEQDEEEESNMPSSKAWVYLGIGLLAGIVESWIYRRFRRGS